MNEKRRGLGRGLGALIPTAPPEGEQEAGAVTTFSTTLTAPSPAVATPAGQPAPVAGAYFQEVPLRAITPNPRQPRQVFEEEAMEELVFSIKEVGLLQPVVVRRISDDGFELIMGERRWRASQQAGLDTIPAIVRQTDDNDMLRDALLENLHRSQLNPLEEAAAYQQMLEDFGCTHEELAGRIGRSRPQISNTLRLLKLSPAVQRRVAAGVLSAGHARVLAPGRANDHGGHGGHGERAHAEDHRTRQQHGQGGGRIDRADQRGSGRRQGEPGDHR